MSFTNLLRIAFVAAAFAAPATAQVQAFGGSAPRMAATRIFFDQGPVGMVCVQYGQGTWKAEYDGMLDTLKGKASRLGKDFWTTFNTSIPLTVGETKVEAGSYYLGIKVDAEGNFHLLVMKAETSDKAGWAPWTADAWKADYTLAMKHGKSDKIVEKMTMDLDVDAKDPAQMTFKISWGGHVLTMPMTAHLAK